MARPSSDIDPRKLNIRGEPLRRRKDRKRPDPPRQLKDGEPEATAALQQMPLSPGTMAEWRKDHWVFKPPHNDCSLWEAQLAQAFGTRSVSLIYTFLDQLRRVAPEDWDSDIGQWKASETEWNALLALVADWKPENAAQAALAAQMAATHLMTMRLMAQAHNYGHVRSNQDLALADRLARTFTMQCETMQLLKGKTRTAKQSIHVTKETHEHVHFHDNRGGGENASQSHGREETQAPNECEAVWSEEPEGRALPRPGGEGEGSMPLPRGKSGGTKG